FEEARARYLVRPEAREVIGVHLAVDHLEAPLGEVPEERREGHFGGVGAPREHALAEEHGAEAHPVQTPYELVAFVSLDAVSEPGRVKAGEPRDELLGDPRAALPSARREGAGPHDLAEARVEADLVGPAAD